MDAKLTYLYLYFLSFAACLVSSCTSDSPDDVVVGKGSEMSFAVSDLSRASVTATFDKFAVYGDTKSSEDNDTGPLVIFNNSEVKYIDGSWYYEGTQYWVPDYEYSFVAITPVSVLEADNNPQYSNSQLSFTYTIPTTDGNLSDKNAVPDILAATHRRLYIPEDDNPNNTVVFRFGHIMSLINIAPALDDNIMGKEEHIEFHRLELSGFKTKAAFSILPAPRQTNSQTDDREIRVTGQEEEGNLTIEFTTPIQVKNDGKSVSLFGVNDDAIIMLPQTFADDSEAKIILTYTINNGPSRKLVTIPLQNLQWESGKGYTYRFTIDRKGPHFGATTITDWEVMNAENIDAH